MEERLLNTIKTGKGEIKDLVLAERELGKWRDVIEHVEGEIRYYNNLVALSTLTIKLAEKEIEAPSALVVTEQVRTNVEVEDVPKAQQTVEAAVAAAGGRMLKSDLKLHAGGHREATLEFEVAPAGATALRERLGRLGVVTKQEAERLQKVAGGSGPAPGLKPQQADVRFSVELYDTANIQPRETVQLKLASRDVRGGHRRLKEALGHAKAQLHHGDVSEPDGVRIKAELSFDIPTQEQEAIDKVLAEVGAVLSRGTEQAQVKQGERVTGRKVGYRVVLLNVAGIPPRETVNLELEVKDVDQAEAALSEWARASKGFVTPAERTYERNGKVSAVLKCDVPLSGAAEVLRKFRGAGMVRDQKTATNAQVPENGLSTAKIEVKLNGAGPLVPSDEALLPQVERSLSFSLRILIWSLMLVVGGVAVILPWALVAWGIYRLVRRYRQSAPSGPAIQ
jgi:hypothetical protein